MIGPGRLLADAPVEDLVPRDATLEDIYLGLTRGMADFEHGQPTGDPR